MLDGADPLPPDLLESTGAEDPEVEVRVEQNQEHAQDYWVAKMRADTERQFAAQISQRDDLLRNYRYRS